MKWGVVLACLLLLASTASAGGSTKTVVAILNSNPEVKAIYVTDGLQLLEGQKVDLWCNATIKDKNGVLDLNATRVVIYNKEHSSALGADSALYNYKPTIKYIETIDKTVSNISALFSLSDNAVGGGWECSVTTVDSKGASDSAKAEFSVYEKTCINGVTDNGEDYQNCGGKYCAPCLELKAVEVEVRAGKEVNVPVEFVSRAPNTLYVGGVDAEDEIRDITVKVDAPNLGVNSKDIVASSATVRVSRKIEPGLHVKTLFVKTTSGVVSQTVMVVRVLPLPPPALQLVFQSSCAKEPNPIRVLDNDTSEAVTDARVEVTHAGKTMLAALSDSSGEVYFTPSEAGVYIVNASKEGYPQESRVLSVVACNQTMKNLVMVVNERMHVGDNISIVVRDQDGNPVSVNIRVTEPDGVTYEFRTDINGMALTQLKKEGHYRIRAEKDRYNATEKTVVVSSLGYQTRYLVCFAVLLAVLIAVAYWIYRRTGST